MADETLTLAFHGAARTVTGSKHLLSAGPEKLLVDCGMFQGLKELRLRNWEPPGFDPRSLGAVLLTHTHIDHCGWLPRLVRQGFSGRIFCTPPTADLLPIVLMDAAKLQQEDAAFFNKHGLTKHAPALPLFTEEDVQHTIARLMPAAYGEPVRLGERLSARFLEAGHILGSAMVEATAVQGGRTTTVLFSGDVGRYDAPLTPDPAVPPGADYLVLESTYGDRLHDKTGPAEELERVVKMVLATGGILLIPAFAVGRSQQLLFLLRQLEAAGRIPRLPVHVDSPMAFHTTAVYLKYLGGHAVKMDALPDGDGLVGGNIQLHRTEQESRKLSETKGPAILIASSGMLSGGRVLHHMRSFMTRRGSVLALSGYQAAGTRGRLLLEGKRALKVFGEEVAIQAEVVDMGGFSGHADADELMRFVGGLAKPPREVFVVHGEPSQSEALAARIYREKGWSAKVPALGEEAAL